MNISGIYKIQSVIKPERCYVGSAVNVKSRWWIHKHHLRMNKHHSPKLQRHCKKYGIDDLVFIIIEPCLPEFLTIRENSYFKPLPFFNIAKVAGSQLGMKQSDNAIIKIKEARAKQVNTRKGVPQSEETKALLREARKKQVSPWPKGSKHSEKTKKRFSEWQIGKKISEETKRKMSIAGKGKPSKLKGRKLSEETKQKMSKAHKGLNTWMKGRPCPESVKAKLREFHKNKKAG